jgi:hypothetical protein
LTRLQLICLGAVELRPEDEVQIRHCRPLSARKRFTLDKVLASPEADRHAARVAHEQAQAQANLSTASSPSNTASTSTKPNAQASLKTQVTKDTRPSASKAQHSAPPTSGSTVMSTLDALLERGKNNMIPKRWRTTAEMDLKEALHAVYNFQHGEPEHCAADAVADAVKSQSQTGPKEHAERQITP